MERGRIETHGQGYELWGLASTWLRVVFVDSSISTAARGTHPERWKIVMTHDMRQDLIFTDNLALSCCSYTYKCLRWELYVAYTLPYFWYLQWLSLWLKTRLLVDLKLSVFFAILLVAWSRWRASPSMTQTPTASWKCQWHRQQVMSRWESFQATMIPDRKGWRKMQAAPIPGIPILEPRSSFQLQVDNLLCESLFLLVTSWSCAYA